MTPLVQDSKSGKREQKILIRRECLQWKWKHFQKKYDHRIKRSSWNRVAYFSYVTRVVVLSNDITIPTFQTLLNELGLFVAWNSGCCKICCGKDRYGDEDVNACSKQQESENNWKKTLYNLKIFKEFLERTIYHSFAAFNREILFSPLEQKISFLLRHGGKFSMYDPWGLARAFIEKNSLWGLNAIGLVRDSVNSSWAVISRTARGELWAGRRKDEKGRATVKW